MSVPASLLPIIRSELSKLRPPGAGDKVYNDECVYSFDSPFSESGLYVDLATYQGVGSGLLAQHVAKTNSKLFLYAKWEQVKKKEEEIGMYFQ